VAERRSKFNVGGEAVIEGVMMRSPHFYAIAVRRADKKIVTTSGPVNSIAEKHDFLKWPLLRGIVSMVESMALGYKSLNYSADVMEADILKEEAKKKGIKQKDVKPRNQTLDMAISLVVAVALFVVLFIMVPQFLTKQLGRVFKEFTTGNIMFNLGMVFFKLIIFFIYVWAISFLEDIKRIFQYHGAEHKSIFVFEAGEKLAFNSTKKYTTRHPRCGTAFIMITLIISLFVFVPFLPPTLKIWQRILYELPLLLPIVAVSYEVLKLSDRFSENPAVKLFIMPGLAFQYLTTKEPDKSQVEVAIKSLNTVVALEEKYLKAHPQPKKVKK
jgi:uncharacterized protein YqhQ